MTRQMISGAFLFFDRLVFVYESNIPPSAGLDVCPLKHPRYIFFSFLGIMLRAPTALHLLVAHIDDITKPIAICNDAYKFVAYPYSIL